MGFLWSTWWLVYLLLLQLRAVARDLAGHMLSFSSLLSSLTLLGLYSSHMLSGMSLAATIFQFSYPNFFIWYNVNLAPTKECDILLSSIIICLIDWFFFEWISLFIFHHGITNCFQHCIIIDLAMTCHAMTTYMGLNFFHYLTRVFTMIIEAYNFGAQVLW